MLYILKLAHWSCKDYTFMYINGQIIASVNHLISFQGINSNVIF